MRTRIQTLLVVAALLGSGAARARAQSAATESRWLAYIGCWERDGVAKSHVCVVPAGDAASVDLVTLVKGEVTARERIAATGENVHAIRGDCAGWQRATWSSHGQRLYLRSEDTCPAGPAIGTGVVAMSGNGGWLYIQSMTIGGQTGVRVQRYREASSEVLLPGDIAAALRLEVLSMMRARAAAGAPLSIDDVVEASRNVDGAVVEAWLVERNERFELDAKRLIALADAGVSPRVIDLMVALSYPKAFAINTASRQGERMAAPSSYGLDTGALSYIMPYDPLCYGDYLMYPYSSYDCAGLGRGYGYGYGYGYGWYPGGYPVTIIPSGGGSSRPHGRVVNGQGYEKGADAATAQAVPRSPDSWSQPSSGSSSGSSGAASGTSSSSGSSGQRTAKPRPPQ